MDLIAKSEKYKTKLAYEKISICTLIISIYYIYTYILYMYQRNGILVVCAVSQAKYIYVCLSYVLCELWGGKIVFCFDKMVSVSFLLAWSWLHCNATVLRQTELGPLELATLSGSSFSFWILFVWMNKKIAFLHDYYWWFLFWSLYFDHTSGSFNQRIILHAILFFWINKNICFLMYFHRIGIWFFSVCLMNGANNCSSIISSAFLVNMLIGKPTIQTVAHPINE